MKYARVSISGEIILPYDEAAKVMKHTQGAKHLEGWGDTLRFGDITGRITMTSFDDNEYDCIKKAQLLGISLREYKDQLDAKRITETSSEEDS